MKKYGFVYIWYDRKHKRYYIGMHWGTENDGYICSSRWMRKAYKRRPEDFRRRILERVYSKRIDLYNRELYWLSLIKDSELKIRYYNISKNVNDAWIDENKNISIKERISQKTKEAMQRPEVRENYLEGIKNRPLPTVETLKKRSQSMIKTMADKFPVENRYNPPKFGSEEYTQNMSNSVAESWETKRNKKEIGENISKALQGKPKTGKVAKGHTKSEEWRKKISESNKNAKVDRKGYFWWNNGVINTKSKESPGSEWIKGKLPHNKSYNSEKMKEIWVMRKSGKIPMPNYIGG